MFRGAFVFGAGIDTEKGLPRVLRFLAKYRMMGTPIRMGCLTRKEPCVATQKMIYDHDVQYLAVKENARNDGFYCRLLY